MPFSFDISSDNGCQRIIIEANVTSIHELPSLPYDAFRAMLYIDDKFIADISSVIHNMPLYIELIDSINWLEAVPF